MPDVVDILEDRVAAAVELIASLRAKVESLERELSSSAEAPLPALPPAPPAPDPELVAELERLQAERGVIRASIRSLLREIDRVAW